MAVKDISANELRELIKSGRAEIIDVRQADEYKIIHIKNSKLIPMNELVERKDEIDWGKQVIFLCRTGGRSKVMSNFISSPEHEVKNLQYGIFECFKDGGSENLEFDESLVERYFG